MQSGSTRARACSSSACRKHVRGPCIAISISILSLDLTGFVLSTGYPMVLTIVAIEAGKYIVSPKIAALSTWLYRHLASGSHSVLRY